MAELILGVLNAVFPTAGFPTTFAECGRYIGDRVDTFRNAPKIVEELKRFGYSLCDGQLKLDIELAEWAYKADDLDPSLRASLEDHLERLRGGLLAADKILDKLFDKDGEVKRGYFLFTGERNAKRVLENLHKWQNDFSGLIALIEMKKRTLPNQMLLSNDKFKTIVRGDGQYCSPIEPGSHIQLASAEISDPSLREVSVIIERKIYGKYANVSELKAIALYLACRLAKSPSNRGLLKCLGYRESPDLELIFEVPNGIGRPQTLRSLIAADAGKGLGGGRPLDSRFRLARQISEAVFS